MNSIYQIIAEIEKTGDAAALCTIIKTRGSTPRHEGSKMLVYPDGRFIGTVGGGEIESRVMQEALESLVDGKTRKLDYSMVNPEKGDPGICGGQVEVYVEPILPKPLVVVIGGGHVGKSLTHLASWLDFRVAVSDDRPELCTKDVHPEADELYPIEMKDLPSAIKMNQNTYLVLTTRGSAVDVEGLPALLETDAAYIGVIGSKRRWILTEKKLLEACIPEDKIKRIHAPIGIEIEAETPEEIAVSIMAEIISLRNGRSTKAK